MRKQYLILVLIVCLCAALAGCFNSANQPEPTPAPTALSTADPMAQPTPGASPAPDASRQPAASPATPTDWTAQGGAVEGRINMLSEIQESRVVVCDNTALVGVKFTSAYQGEMTQRIRDMIAGEVMAVDSAVQVVAVTGEPSDVDAIYQLADRQRAGASNEEIKPEVEKIAKNATTLR